MINLLDRSGNFLHFLPPLNPHCLFSQQSHDWDGLPPVGLSDVVLLQCRDDWHVRIVSKLRDAGLHVLRTVGDDDGDVELDVRVG